MSNMIKRAFKRVETLLNPRAFWDAKGPFSWGLPFVNRALRRWADVPAAPRYHLCLLLLAALLLYPVSGFQTYDQTALLAKTLYGMAGSNAQHIMMDLGSVALNRMEDGRYPDALHAILDDPRVFSRGCTYSQRAWEAARKLLRGARTLDREAVYIGRDAQGGWVFYGDEEVCDNAG